MTPKIFNGSWDQSNANYSHEVSRKPHDEPIHNALVLSTFIFNPDRAIWNPCKINKALN